MSLLDISSHETIDEVNRYNLSKLHDALGEENIIIAGTKTLKPNPKNIVDELVWFPYKERAVTLTSGAEGGGKTVFMEWQAYQTNCPIVPWDVQKQTLNLREPLREKFAIERLAALKIIPQPLRVFSFEPYFASLGVADKRWSIKLKDYRDLSEYEAHNLFVRSLAIETMSEANQRAADEIWQEASNPKTPIADDMKFLFDSYDRHYYKLVKDEKKLGASVGKSLYTNLRQQRILKLYEGEGIDFRELLNSKKYDVFSFLCSFASSEDSFSYYMRFYSIFLAVILHDYRRRNQIPRVTKIRDEVDEALKTPEGEVIAREIKKDRTEQNNLLYATQYIGDASKEMVGSSHAIFTTRIRSERDLELISRKNSNDSDLRKLNYLETKTTPMQFAMVTYDTIEPFYPLSPPAQYHSRFT